MSAAALATGVKQNGLRPVNLRTDLGGIADLIEICFADQMDARGRATVREMRALSRLGPLLWLLAGLNRAARGVATGFVWVEGGRVVGNVSLYHAAERAYGWIIANVAVHPDYRRRGIARDLVHASLDMLRARGAPSAVLQVKHDNDGAVALYRQLGFYHVRTWDTWRRPAHLGALPVDFDQAENLDDLVELAGANDWRAVYDLARIARPTGLGWMRATTPGAFRPGLWGALGDYLSGKVEERYVVRAGGSGDALVAAVTISMPLASAVDVLTLMVHPGQRGRLERPLLAYALRRLQGRRRAVAIEHPHDDTAGAAALEALGFVRRETLAVMRHDLR